MKTAACYFLAFILMLSTFPANAEESTHFEFSGEVVRGKEFTHTLPNGLEFMLMPRQFGWEIAIRRLADATTDFVNLTDITLPLHGPNPTDVEGWNLRNSDNTGANEPGPKNLNVWGEEREFRFALSAHDLGRYNSSI